ncbi:hypothetical protein C0995_009149 [Termitomyces sp. Mi166|nr:hypothetical protein C0995_009149 [Termitomyces sp. Mi166\
MLQALRQISSRLRDLQSRQYTTPSAQHSIYISKSTNPYFNLTLEDWLFRHKAPEEPLLLIYRDDPCVVVGRNQNPWKEVNFRALRERPGVPFIRRRSGGGTVYHDLGNTNFSIHLPRAKFDRHVTAQIVLRAHVSGSAYKIVNKRAYHHGTMLISTQLDTLGDLLRTDRNQETMVTKGVASVRSPVCNLQQFSAIITHDSFTDAVIDEFRKEYGVSAPVRTNVVALKAEENLAQAVNETDEFKSIEYIQKGMEELPSWDWAYGQTPEFTYTIHQTFDWGKVTVEFSSKHGIINQCTLEIGNSKLSDSDMRAVIELGRLLEGQRYGFLKNTWDNQEETGPRRDVLTWIDGIVHT